MVRASLTLAPSHTLQRSPDDPDRTNRSLRGPYTMHTRGFDYDFGPQERKGATVLTGEICREWTSELWRCCEEGSGAVFWFLLFTASVLQGTYKKQYLGPGQR